MNANTSKRILSLTCPRAALSDAIAGVVDTCDPRSTMPILANIKIQATADGQAVLCTTNLNETSRRSLKDVQVTAPGSVTIPGQALHRAVKAFAGESVTIEVAQTENGPQALIRAGQSRLTLPALDVRDFPRVDTVPENGQFQPDAELGALLSRAVRFASEDKSRPPFLQCVSVTEDYIMASDGMCALFVRHSGAIKNIIMPSPIVKMIPAGDDVQFCATKDAVFVRTEDGIWSSKMMAGAEIPNPLTEHLFGLYKDLFDGDGTYTWLDLDIAQFTQALNLSSITDVRGSAPTVDLSTDALGEALIVRNDTSDNRIQLSSPVSPHVFVTEDDGVDHGENEDDKGGIRITIRFLLTAIKALDGKTSPQIGLPRLRKEAVVLRLNTKIGDQEVTSALAVVMPIARN